MSEAPDLRTRADKRLHRSAVDVSASTRRCRCSTGTLPGPAGDVLVLGVAGEVDLDSVVVLDAALDEVLNRRPDHLVVDLSGLIFCSARGLSALAGAARVAAADGTRYSIGGASPLFARLWPLYWPDGEAPPIHPTTAAAVLSAVGLQADPGNTVRAAAGACPVAKEHDPGGRTSAPSSSDLREPCTSA